LALLASALLIGPAASDYQGVRPRVQGRPQEPRRRGSADVPRLRGHPHQGRRTLRPT
jgi:hypothetical protein